MKHLFTCILLFGTICGCLYAQDKIVLRNGNTIEVYVRRSLENRVEYTYPDETSVYERPKTSISYILYQDGRQEVCDENAHISSTDHSAAPERGTSSATPTKARTPSVKNRPSDDGEIFWQDVKTTSLESEVSHLSRLKRISAVSVISYKDAIQQLKKKAAAIGGTTILVMDVPENDSGNDIEVIGIAYRDENIAYTPRSTDERNAVPEESPSNIRRRRIAQQMESYHNESNLIFEDTPPSSSRQPPSSQQSTSSQQTTDNEKAPDVVYLMSGQMIRGMIEELEPDDFVSIRTPAGKVFEYSMDDVKRISRNSTGRRKNKSAASDSKYSSRTSSRYDEERDRNESSRSSRSVYPYDDNYHVSGYKGTFDAGYNLPIGGTGEKGCFELNTSHGYQINKYLFVGAGLGLHMYNARDPKMKLPDNYPHYVGPVDATSGIIRPTDSVTYLHAVDSSYMTMPLFLDLRGYLPLQNGKIVPFAMLRFGYAFNLSDKFGGMGLYVNPAVGVKFQVSPMIGINVSIGYAFQNYGGVPGKNRDGGYGYYYFKNATDRLANIKYQAKGAGSISLKLGIEF
jgi:hypothetical protein